MGRPPEVTLLFLICVLTSWLQQLTVFPSLTVAGRHLAGFFKMKTYHSL